MRRLLVLSVLIGSAVGCRGVLGIEPPPVQKGSSASPDTIAGGPSPSAGKSSQKDTAGRDADDDDTSSTAHAGEAAQSAGRGGMLASGPERGGSGGASAGRAGMTMATSGQAAIDPPGSVHGDTEEPAAGHGGSRAGSGGAAGVPSAGMPMMQSGGAGAGGAGSQSMMSSGSGGAGMDAPRDPCAGVMCGAPPRATCANATTVRQYASTGTCTNGACSYPSSDTSCGAKTPKCHEGACVGCVNDADCSTGDQCSSAKVCIKAQFLLIDETYTATAADIDNEGRYNTVTRFGIPADWTKPINFIDGMVYVELDILEKPSDVATLYNICFVNDLLDACMPYAPTYTKPGRIEFNSSFERFWQYAEMDWTKGVNKIQIYLKNDKEQKRPGSDPAFYPTKAHVTVTVVAPGATYIPPAR